MHAGPQFNAQNGGTIEKFCSSHPSLSRLHTISLVSYSDTVVRRSKSVETSAFNLRVTEQSEGRDGASAAFSVCRQSVWATDARLSYRANYCQMSPGERASSTLSVSELSGEVNMKKRPLP